MFKTENKILTKNVFNYQFLNPIELLNVLLIFA